MYAVNDIKEAMTLRDVELVLERLGGEPRMQGGQLVSKTVCHGGESHKLYYYEDSRMFHCYSDSCGSFDVFDLVAMVTGCGFKEAVEYVVDTCHMDPTSISSSQSNDWNELARMRELLDVQAKRRDQDVMATIGESELRNLPCVHIPEWEACGIPDSVSQHMGVRYNPVTGGVVIPHRDVNGELVGVRERTMVKSFEAGGKYKPAVLGGHMLNHPLGFHLYGLHAVKENIGRTGVAIVAESEKSVLQSMAMFGYDNSLAVASCGSNISRHQVKLLLDCGCRRMVIAFDKDYRHVDSKEYWGVLDKLRKLYHKYSPQLDVSFLFDREGTLLGYKDSPFDCGKDTFMQLWRDQVIP